MRGREPAEFPSRIKPREGGTFLCPRLQLCSPPPRIDAAFKVDARARGNAPSRMAAISPSQAGLAMTPTNRPCTHS
ncbi:hypothetical protein GUJ93_ZPchr0007g3705 [Zizania palustris]|uniref:Uncharacterized protein n=1 Tax=Zizania palustris TaxID=103762 RepID=A0A8J5T8P9_ZIZPA|nr:hypothetical protein GUJ93_ZPchr0007g3705 [Zizania palustris]